MYINRLYLRPSILPSGLTTLQECASLDVATGWEGLDEDSLLKLDSAVKRLDLETWLQGRGLGTVLPVLVREGCSSKEALHRMDPQRALQVHFYCWPDRQLVSLCRCDGITNTCMRLAQSTYSGKLLIQISVTRTINEPHLPEKKVGLHVM